MTTHEDHTPRQLLAAMATVTAAASHSEPARQVTTAQQTLAQLLTAGGHGDIAEFSMQFNLASALIKLGRKTEAGPALARTQAIFTALGGDPANAQLTAVVAAYQVLPADK